MALQINAARASHPGRIARGMFRAYSSLEAMRCVLLETTFWGMPFLGTLCTLLVANHSS